MNHLRHLLTAILLLCLASVKAQEVTFSTQGGFYDEPFTLTLSCSLQDKVIRYTTNGTTPTATSPVYREPLPLNESLYSHSDIFTVQNSPDPDWVCPQTVKKCIVIRAAAFDDLGNRIGTVTTQSYFFTSLGCDTHGLPVMSLCADSLDLFDYETGIFVPGIHFNPSDPDHTGNYFQTGRDWERQINIEYYETDNQGINQQGGLRTQGYSTRRFPQKGLKIYARESYGAKRFQHKFFPNLELTSFKRLKLKPFQGGWETMGCQDYLCSLLAHSIALDCLASRPIVLYLNGEYWGIYYLQEKPDEYFFEDHFDTDDQHLNIIDTWGGHCEVGDNADYLDLFHWIEESDLSDEGQYRQAATRIDIDNFIDYEIFEIFTANLDWPNNNMRCWQQNGGPWRWLFFDGDACIFRPHAQFDAFDNATYTGESTYPSSRKATLVFRKLMQNETFKVRFCARFNQLLSTHFNYDNTKPLFDQTFSLITDEIDNQSQRFCNPPSHEAWENQVRKIDLFLSQRCDDMNRALREHFLTEDTGLTLCNLYPNPAQGQINIKVEAANTTVAHLQIFDMWGREVTRSLHFLRTGLNEITLPIDLSSGVYVLRLGNASRKIIVIR